jgi:hypothetical protein
MNQKSEHGLYEALEKELRKAEEPLNAAELFDFPSVREHAETINRVSDYLGNLWRKGLLMRLPAPRMDGSKARWAYMWKDKGPKKKPKLDLSQAIVYDERVERIINRPHMDISEDERQITIALQDWIITIQKRDQE